MSGMACVPPKTAMNTTRRYIPILIAGCALIAAACRDSVAPTPTNASVVAYGQVAASSRVTRGHEEGVKTFVFSMRPQGGRVRLGDFTLTYDANAVCDPATSGYGPTLWMTACETLKRPIEITARFWTEDGHNFAEFKPDIRFSPSADVTLLVNRPEIIGRRRDQIETFKYSIWYVLYIGDERLYIDESAVDPSVAMQYDIRSGKAWRRIRHFSGWSVRTGRSGGDCDSSGEGSCNSYSEQ